MHAQLTAFVKTSQKKFKLFWNRTVQAHPTHARPFKQQHSLSLSVSSKFQNDDFDPVDLNDESIFAKDDG
jgi:hypothetical protein